MNSYILILPSSSSNIISIYIEKFNVRFTQLSVKFGVRESLRNDLRVLKGIVKEREREFNETLIFSHNNNIEDV